MEGILRPAEGDLRETLGKSLLVVQDSKTECGPSAQERRKEPTIPDIRVEAGAGWMDEWGLEKGAGVAAMPGAHASFGHPGLVPFLKPRPRLTRRVRLGASDSLNSHTSRCLSHRKVTLIELRDRGHQWQVTATFPT
jgi:hypothetical protein